MRGIQNLIQGAASQTIGSPPGTETDSSADQNKKQFNCMFWNSKCIINFLELDQDEKLEILELQVKGVSKTWELNEPKLPNWLTDDFIFLYSKAIRIGTRGRGSEGILLLINKKLQYNILTINKQYIFIELTIRVFFFYRLLLLTLRI